MEPGKASNNLKEDQSQKREPSTSTGSKTSRPRRGRPAGANRTPLSLEERRARNAQYERERREDLAKAHSELAEAAGCDPNISTDDLMTLVITKLQQTIPAEDIRLANVDLEAQIAKCIEQLPPDYIVSDDEEEVQPEEPNTRKRKPSHRDTFSDDKRMRLGGTQMPAVGWMISPADFAEAVPGPGPGNYEWEDVDAFLAEQLSSFNAEAPPVVPSVALPPNPPMTPLATQRPRNYEWEDVDAFLAEQLSSFNAESPPVVPPVALPPNPPMTLLETPRPLNYEWEDVDAFYARPEATPNPPMTPLATPLLRNYDWEDVDAFLAEQLSSFNAESPSVVPSVALPPNPPMTLLETPRPLNYEWEDVDAFYARPEATPNPPMTPLATPLLRNYDWEDVDAFFVRTCDRSRKQLVANNFDIGSSSTKSGSDISEAVEHSFLKSGADQFQSTVPVHKHLANPSTAQLNHFVGNRAIQCTCPRQRDLQADINAIY
ncbi:unnamed protein product [Spodoptera littoralis]|uniref:Uncharacterized protein n=1 Tax=Spodoptera littoralis TaxID=7109 RepID=A0A9P0I048_SPOLI|nr:unnamed protein product [Spodoptera littoralis]CAH1637733.1 unnamed protein product [Spodoptera littoralis]